MARGPSSCGKLCAPTCNRVIGCGWKRAGDKRAVTCRKKFNNFLNFRGFPDIPGEDWLMSYPIPSERNDGGDGRETLDVESLILDDDDNPFSPIGGA